MKLKFYPTRADGYCANSHIEGLYREYCLNAFSNDSYSLGYFEDNSAEVFLNCEQIDSLALDIIIII